MGKFKSVLKGCNSLVDRGLSAAVPLLATTPSPDGPAIFIVGGPRSGSTLAYQTLVHCRRFAYLNNFLARFPRSAAAVARLVTTSRWPVPHEFTSDYGDTEGLNAPSEAGDFWDHVFPWHNHHAVQADDFPPSRVLEIQRVVSTLVAQYEAPFLCKNLWHSVRIPALNVAFPKALFIVMQRSPLLMAQSVLDGRRKVLGENTGFWSIRPTETAQLERLPPVDHVGYQLAFTYQAIANARDQLGADRFFDLPYEKFCEAPQIWVERIDRFLSDHGVRVQSRGQINGSFESHCDIHLSDTEQTRLLEIIRQEWPVGYRTVSMTDG